MLPEKQISFLKEKIQDIRSALFCNMSNSVLKMPTTIISTLKVDEIGQIWFFIPRPLQFIHEFDREFPVRLDYFRKGRDFFMRILGKAFIVSDPEEINSLLTLSPEEKDMAYDKLVLIKVQMQAADYFEKGDALQSSGWKKIWSVIMKIEEMIKIRRRKLELQPRTLMKLHLSK